MFASVCWFEDRFNKFCVHLLLVFLPVEKYMPLKCNAAGSMDAK